MVNIWNLTCFYFTQLVQIVEVYLHSREGNCFETGKLEVYATIIGGISMDIRYLSTHFFIGKISPKRNFVNKKSQKWSEFQNDQGE